MVSFAQNVRPLFRDKDVKSMSFAFDLSDYSSVRANAEAIYQSVASGEMPCDDKWPDEKVALFKEWIDAKMPE
ncbi:MAG: hypothetical protein M3014_15490 [Chloroflexota bacterium]|nr:hypothetical protein [Chloroflexota bacterium]